MTKVAFLKLFGVRSSGFPSGKPGKPWIWLKKCGVYINANLSIYNEEDQQQIKNLLKNNR